MAQGLFNQDHPTHPPLLLKAVFVLITLFSADTSCTLESTGTVIPLSGTGYLRSMDDHDGMKQRKATFKKGYWKPYTLMEFNNVKQESDG